MLVASAVFKATVGAVLALTSTIIAPNTDAEALPQVIVVPVNPLSRLTYSAPVAGVPYPVSFFSVQLVGAVIPATFVLLPTTPRVGLYVFAFAENAGAGVPAAWFSCFAVCLMASSPTNVIPDIRATCIIAPVAASPVQSKVTVIEELAARALATKQ